MEALKRYLEKLLNLPGLSWFTPLTGALFVFSGWPMLGSWFEKLLPWSLGYDTDAWTGQEVYLGYFVATFLLFMVGLGYDRNRRARQQHTMEKPPRAPVVVMMASHMELLPDTATVLLGQTNPTDFWRTLKAKVAPNEQGRLPPGSWWELVFRNVEYHRGCLGELILLYSADSVWAAPETQQRAQKVLDRWLNLTQDRGAVQITWRPLNGHGSNLERVRTEIVALHSELQRKGRWATYDLTGGTAAMTGGMVLACVSESYHLQYFPQGLTGNSSNPLEKVAWGELPIEHQLGLGPGLLPLLVDTDADAVASAIGSSQG